MVVAGLVRCRTGKGKGRERKLRSGGGKQVRYLVKRGAEIEIDPAVDVVQQELQIAKFFVHTIQGPKLVFLFRVGDI